MKLASLLRRDPAAPTLRDRAAGLRASLGWIRSQPVSLPSSENANDRAQSPEFDGTGADAALLALREGWEAAVAAYDRTIQDQIAVTNAAPSLEPPPAREPNSEWLRLIDGWRERTGVDAAENASSKAMDHLTEIEDRIAAMPATTLARLKLKARVAQRNDDVAWPENLGEGIVRDILAIGEREVEADAELIRLGHLFEVARNRELAACDACNEAGREAERLVPARPVALVLKATDHPLRIYRQYTHPLALEGVVLRAGDIEWLRKRMPMMHEVLRPIREGERAHVDHPGRKFEMAPHPEAQTRAEEIITAWDTWQGERTRLLHEHVTEELEEVAETAGAEALALAQQIASTPAHTAAGFRVKLKALSHYRSDVLLSEVPEMPDADQILSHSLWRDVQAEPQAVADDVDWEAPPPGFMAYPTHKPAGFLHIEGGLKLELERLLRIAGAEFERRVDSEMTGETIDRLRRKLRLDALAAAIRADAPTRGQFFDRNLSREAFDYAHGLDLSPVQTRNLIRLYEVFRRTSDLLGDVEQEAQFWTPTLGAYHTAGGVIIDAEQNRLGCLRDACVMELARRTPKTEEERDAALVVRVRHEMLCEMKIRSKAMLSEIREAWGGE